MDSKVCIGDYVRCIDVSSTRMDLTFGKYYKIISIDLIGTDRLHMYYITDDNNKCSAYFMYRFEYDIQYNRRKKLERLKSI